MIPLLHAVFFIFRKPDIEMLTCSVFVRIASAIKKLARNLKSDVKAGVLLVDVHRISNVTLCNNDKMQ